MSGKAFPTPPLPPAGRSRLQQARHSNAWLRTPAVACRRMDRDGRRAWTQYALGCFSLTRLKGESTPDLNFLRQNFHLLTPAALAGLEVPRARSAAKISRARHA